MLPNKQTQILNLKIFKIFIVQMNAQKRSKDLQGSGFVKIDLIASSTLEIVRAGLQLSFKMPILKLPAASTLQW